MKNEKQLLILLAASLRKGTNAWIPDMVGRRTTLLRTQDEHDITFRLRLEDMFADGDLPPLTENTDSLQALPVNDWIDSTTDVYSDWSDTSPCYGEECDVSTTFTIQFEKFFKTSSH